VIGWVSKSVSEANFLDGILLKIAELDSLIEEGAYQT